MRFAVLYCQKFDFEDENGGKVRGIQLHFFDPAARADSSTERGLPIMNAFSKDLHFDDFHSLPAYYDLDIRLRRGARGKMQSFIAAADFLAPMLKNSDVEAA